MLLDFLARTGLRFLIGISGTISVKLAYRRYLLGPSTGVLIADTVTAVLPVFNESPLPLSLPMA
jgi:hypothetical protein